MAVTTTNAATAAVSATQHDNDDTAAAVSVEHVEQRDIGDVGPNTIFVGGGDNGGGSGTHGQGDSVVVRYDPPFDQYPAPVARVLQLLQQQQQRRHQPATTATTKATAFEDLLDEAAWYVDLAMAHRSVLDLDSDHDDYDDKKGGYEENEQRAETALLQAVAIYEGLLQQLPGPHRDNPSSGSVPPPLDQEGNEHSLYDIQHHLAATLFHLAEVYSESATPHRRARAHDHYQRAHDLYHQLLLVPFTENGGGGGDAGGQQSRTSNHDPHGFDATASRRRQIG